MGERQGFSHRDMWRKAALLCALSASFSAPLQAQRDDAEVRPFALPNTRAAQGLVTAVEEHLAADRPLEAIARLQELLEEHAGALLPGRRSSVGGFTSQQLVHQGVGPWATAHLFALPAGPQDSYITRYEEIAQAQLERALRTADRESLAAVGTRWPLTSAAEQAWWALGDLSLERGDLAESRSAWKRAIAWALKLPSMSLEIPADWRALTARFEDRADLKEISARLEFAASSLDSSPSFDADLQRPPHGELRLPGQGDLHKGPSVGEGSSWSKPFALRDHPYTVSANNFYAARSKDRVVVSDSMRAICLQAFSGEVLWDSGKARGWENLTQREIKEFHLALDNRYAMIAPALTEQVAVCALEVPFSAIKNQDYNNIQILRIIPDRRLFAFDLETGKELWSHQPEPDWDGESGTFTETSRVAGPAIISGGRVIVPVYRLEGRISFHLACYELATGELIWNTQLISGQRELNMFNRHQREFSAPPARIEGDRVIALTQLGVVACLDLFNGQILWETVYDQVAIPRRSSNYRAQQQEFTWSNSPPVIGDGVVVCTPFDSYDMIGLDLKSGAMLWSLGHRDLESLAGGHKAKLRHLVGCDATTVFLSGERVIAVEAPLGLSKDAPTRARWVADEDSSKISSYPPRAVLLEDRVVIPTTDHRSDIDRHQGFLLSNPSRWSKISGPGNLLICEDAVFTLNNRQLNGHFEWESLIEKSRASLAAQPTSQELANDLAKLLCERGRAEMTRDRAELAYALFDEAQALLRVNLGSALEQQEKTQLLYEALIERARAAELLQDSEGALIDWAEASLLAPSPRETLSALIEQQRLLRDKDPSAWLELLEQIESKCEGMEVNCVESEEGFSSLTAAPLTHESEVSATWALDVKLWATFLRIDHHRARDERAKETAELYRLLMFNGEIYLPIGSPRDLALRRLDQLLSGPEAEALLEPYEALASALLAQLDGLSVDAVASVLHQYPRTQAAAQAAARLLAFAVESGDVPTAAKLVLDLLPETFSLGVGDPANTASVLSLGLALKETGNSSYLRACLKRLKEANSLEPSALQGLLSMNIAELEEELLSIDPPVAVSEPSFTSRARPAWNTPDGVDIKILGELPPALDGPLNPERMLLVGSRNNQVARLSGELMAFGASDLSEPRWRQKLNPGTVPFFWGEELHLFGPGYAVVASNRALVSVSRADGSTRWTWSPEEGELSAIYSTGGLILARVSVNKQTVRIQALDDEHGVALWSYEYDSRSFHSTITVGEAWLALLPKGRLRHALILDAFTGRIAHSLNLKTPLGNSSVNGAWIQDEKLFIPHLSAQAGATDAAQVDLVDLTRSSEPWTITLSLRDGGGAKLESVLHHAGRTWLVVRPKGGEINREGAIFELHSGVGAAAQINGISINHRELILGTRTASTLRLDSSQIFIRTEEQGGSLYRLRSHDLSTGARLWSLELGSNRDLYNRSWPIPAVSTNAVAMVYTEKGAANMRTNILFIDPLSGLQQGNWVLDESLGWSDQIVLKALGDGILITGVQKMEIRR
jgi:outer membrane protein assembly factor BamB